MVPLLRVYAAIMKNKILLPTDFSKNARSAALYAIEMFKDENVEFILLNTSTIPFSAENVLVFVDDLFQKESAKNLKREKEYLLKKHHLPSNQVKIRSKDGILPLVVGNIIENEKIDFVVMGTKRASAFKKKLIGSNTVEVLRKVNCPVLIVPEGCTYKPMQLAVAIDFKPIDSEQLLTSLKVLIQNRKLKITLIKILTEDEFISTNIKLEESKLKSTFKDYTVEYQYIEDENIIHGLNQFIRNKNINLLVMIAHRYPFIKMLFHNSITEDMSMISRIPLLIIKDQLN